MRAARKLLVLDMADVELSPTEWVQDQTKKILETGTTEGIEVFGKPIVLLTVRGAKSGKLRYTPVMRVEHDGSYAVVASKGGAPEHPTWYHNIKAHPEIVLQGVRVDLLDANGSFLRSTLTVANGAYQFSDLAPGTYQVREHQPAGYYDGEERVGSAGGTLLANDQIGAIIIGSDVHAINYDFCEHVGVTLSGNVYHDRDDDGNFDRGTEEGIGGVVLKLLDEQGHDTGLRATTNAARRLKACGQNRRRRRWTTNRSSPAWASPRARRAATMPSTDASPMPGRKPMCKRCSCGSNSTASIARIRFRCNGDCRAARGGSPRSSSGSRINPISIAAAG